jgi:tetratricopeptide (TPR) repeat protein
MGAQLQMTLPAPAIYQERHSLQSSADTTLKGAVRFWFAVVVIGQLIFAFAVASFYGLAAVRGTSPQAWSQHITHGYVAGDIIGNFAVATHLFSAVIVILAGMLQLTPQIRNRFPIFHRWTGRLYIATASAISLAGLYMTWVRGSVGDLKQHLGSTLMALLIMLFAAMALRYAMARDFRTHRRWALRLYLVVSASLFIRAGIFLSLLLNRGPFGFDPATFSGPFLTFISFAQYLVPLAVLEIYFRTQQHAGAPGRFAMAAGLIVSALALAAGIFAVTLVGWLPQIKKAYDSRKSIAGTLSATVASSGIDEALKQYYDLKSAGAATAYNFDEDELNTLGYELLHANKFKEAIRIFQLNVEVYPQSANTYDSLAEAYMGNSDKLQAIANYQKSLQLNPKNLNAVGMLKKLNAP